MVNYTKLPRFGRKKTRSVSSAQLVGGSSAALDGGAYVNATSQYDLFNIPANCLITDAYVIPKEAGQASLTVDIGYNGGAELIDDGAVSSTTVVKDAGIKLDSGTGKLVTAVFSAAPTQGRFFVVVEYIEYRVANGAETTN